MERFVLNVFKAIMFAMISIFVFDMTSYLYRAMSINNKMLNLTTSLQRVVMENNYLPENQYLEYETLFKNLAKAYNGDNSQEHVGGSILKETFVEGFNINYGREFTATNKGEIVAAFENLNPDMAVAGKYGSITCVQVSVGINQPIWDFNSYSSVQGGERGMPNFNRVRYRTVELTYTYYVPCLHYQRVESEE